MEKKKYLILLNFCLLKKQSPKEPAIADYKDKILSISAWSKDDVSISEENKRRFNEWAESNFEVPLFNTKGYQCKGTAEVKTTVGRTHPIFQLNKSWTSFNQEN